MIKNIVKFPFRKLRALWNLYKSNPCNLGVIQIFIHDSVRETSYSLTNYPSFLLPRYIRGVWYQISLFDEVGQLVFSTTIKIPKYGSAKIIPSELCPGRVPERGIFQANLKASRLGLLNKYYLQRLGKLTSHFYTMFYAHDFSSLAMIHPQTVAPVPDSSEKSNFWYSQFLIHVPSLTRLEIFQLNPCQSEYDLNLKAMNLKGEILAESKSTVPGYGTRVIEWDKQLFRDEYIYLSSDTLRGNEKPILFSHYADGSFTALHT